MRRLTTFVAGLGALSALVMAWHFVAERSQAVDIANRGWIERAPKDSRDEVGWLVLVDHRARRIGSLERRSAFRFSGERFAWSRQGKRVHLTFPQSDRRVEVELVARRCRDHGFDLCLDVTRGGRTTTMYSRKDWKLPAGSATVPQISLTELDEVCQSCVDAPPASMRGLLP